MSGLESHLLVHGLTVATALIELLAAIVIAYHVALAVVLIAKGKGVDAARMAMAEGVLAGLSFSVAATLLKTIALEDWAAIRMFAFVLALRTLLKMVFERERNSASSRVQRRLAFAQTQRSHEGMSGA